MQISQGAFRTLLSQGSLASLAHLRIVHLDRQTIHQWFQGFAEEVADDRGKCGQTERCKGIARFRGVEEGVDWIFC